MPRKSYKSLYADAQRSNRQKDKQISELQGGVSDLESKLTSKTAEYEQQSRQHEERVSVLEQQKQESDEQNKVLRKEIEDRDERIRNMELRRFAVAYEKQETAYSQDQERWFKLSVWATVLLIISIFFSILGPSRLGLSVKWYEQSGFYLLNAIFVTLFVYSLRQHSHFGRLKVDYANRKTLAQSYQHIIEDEEDEEIKQRFLDRSADVFTARPDSLADEVTPQESLVSKVFKKTEK